MAVPLLLIRVREGLKVGLADVLPGQEGPVSAELETHMLPWLSAAMPSGLLRPPPLIGDRGVGVPFGFSIATALLPLPATNACPRRLNAMSKGFSIPRWL
jgi:hypothetical protein